MNNPKKIQNILAFLALMYGDDIDRMMKYSPDYILEKFERYCESERDDEYKWGIHPNLLWRLEVYCKRWKLDFFPLWGEEDD